MFIGLHNHTEHSNYRGRDAMIRVKDLINYTHELGHKGVAITEHETIGSTVEAQDYFQSVIKTDGWEDYKLILGNEIYLCDRSVNADNKEHLVFPHAILLALDAKGHEQIRQLSTTAWMQCFNRGRMMRVPLYYDQLFDVIDNDKGHVAFSTACLGSALDRQLLSIMEQNANEDEVLTKCRQWILTMEDVFGKGNFFLEMQPSDNPQQIFVNEKLLYLGTDLNIPYIITTDSHYLKKTDRDAHRIFLQSQDIDREVDAFYATTYVMSEEEIHSYMDRYLGETVVQTGINNTMLVWEKAENWCLFQDLKIPYLPFDTTEPNRKLYKQYVTEIPLLEEFYRSEIDSDRHLVREIVNRLDSDPTLNTPEAYKEIQKNLNSIKISSEANHVPWSAYLLTVKDLVRLAWEAGSIVGAGRGSGVGFLLLHVLGITQVNPLREDVKTFDWRFLNPERVTPLDIDIDIEKSKRNVVIQKLRDSYGADKVSKVQTLSTEGPRSAILTAARGLGIDNDIAQYIASLVTQERGMTHSLSQMYYGDEENGIKPNKEFISAVNEYPDLWEVAQKIEGIIVGTSQHAGGVVIVGESFTKHTALMKTNNGEIITQFDLHQLEKVGCIKHDILAVSLDKIHQCLDLLADAGRITRYPTLKETYENCIGIYKLERNDPKMWQMLWNREVLSFFQMEKESGIQAVALVKPDSVGSLAIINSVMRLMPQEEGQETPLVKYARFKSDPSLWIKEMNDVGLTEEEQDILRPILETSSGICEAQEVAMQLVMLPQCGGYSLKWADTLRKSIAKKNPAQFKALEEEFLNNIEAKHLSRRFCEYVWYTLIYTQRGYGFNRSHTLAYSLIGLQELNLAYRFPIIYWNCANLIVDSGSLEDAEENKGTNYSKTATAIGYMQQHGIKIILPTINEARFTFYPDEQHNEIVYALKAISGLSDEMAREIVKRRPFTSFEDFCERMEDTGILVPSKIIPLIKAGAFIKIDNPNRAETLRKYLMKYRFTPLEKLTYQQLAQADRLGIIPQEYKDFIRLRALLQYTSNDRFVVENVVNPDRKIPKSGFHDRLLLLDKYATAFYQHMNLSETPIVRLKGELYVVSEKEFKKLVTQTIQPLTDWLASEEAAKAYNDAMFDEVWKAYASGTIPHWEMESLGYYYSGHELQDVDLEKYGIKRYTDLPETPPVYDTYVRWIGKEKRYIPKYEIVRIAGTVIGSDNMKHRVYLMTPDAVVTVKMGQGQYTHYQRQLSVKDSETGSKTVTDQSWFKRGTLLVVCGYRDGAVFKAARYNDTVYPHTVARINNINGHNELELQMIRGEDDDE